MARSILDDMRAAGANPEIMAQLEAQLAPAPSPQPTSAQAHEAITTVHPALAAVLLSAAVNGGVARVRYDSLNAQIVVRLEGSITFTYAIHDGVFWYSVGDQQGPRRTVSRISNTEHVMIIKAAYGAIIR